MNDERLPHLIVEGFFGTEKYTAVGSGNREFNQPRRDRATHGVSVRDQLERIRGENERKRGAAEKNEPAPITIEFRSEPGFVLKLDSVENRTKGIEVACVRSDGDVQVATVHIPEGALTHFLKITEQYLNENTRGTEKSPPRPKHQELVDRMGELRLATLRSFWTDDQHEFPPAGVRVWWEIWIRHVGGQNVWASFEMLAETNGLTVGKDVITFPDRTVGLIHGTAEQLMASAELLDMIGEVRRAKENPADFIKLDPKDQAEWVESLLPKITPPPAEAPVVCLLDGGVVLHPLVDVGMNQSDLHRFDPNWPLADSTDRPIQLQHTHGTEMAGVILYGRELASLLAESRTYELSHGLESVRVLPPKPYENERRLFGAITAQAVSRVEIASSDRKRCFCMAITTDGHDRGRPSSWSGVVDQICAGVNDQHRRLFFVSAGNADPNHYHRYPESNDTDGIKDPAQAWNAITVGATTDCATFDTAKFPNYVPIATAGDLSPSSTTSVSWDKPWPYKPDIVLEGGNHVYVPGTSTVMDPDEMAMLTTAHATTGRLLVDFRDTSAAAAQAARMAAIIHAQYPELWPETLRALLIHSAEWTPQMRNAYGNTKADHVLRLRRYGYGIPNLDRALYSANDSLTLIAQQTIQPFTKEEYSIKTRDMGIHELPWPKEQLLDLGEQQVRLRVTLSYFVEPKPGRREGFVKNRHRYQSHGLRFEVKRAQENNDEFRKRISKAARDEEETFEAVGGTAGWELGPQVRTRGSIHSDWWTGTAADLANSGLIAVYPKYGWWRESKGNDWAKEARYALIVSIKTEPITVPVSLFSRATVDLYTPIETKIQAAKTPIAVDVNK